jgi:hypothetical protein
LFVVPLAFQVKIKKGMYTINGKATSCATLVELTEYLREKRGKSWPLSLTTGIIGLPLTGVPTVVEDDEGGADDSFAIADAAARRADAAASAEREVKKAAADQASAATKAAMAAGDAVSAAYKSGEWQQEESNARSGVCVCM